MTTVAGLQHDIVWEEPDANFARLGPRIAELAAGGARIVLLTEMFSTGFSMDTDRIAEAPGGPAHAFLADSAREHGAWVGGSIATRDGDGLATNRFVLAGPDGRTLHYDKVHPFTYGGEHEHYAGGDALVTWEIEGLRVTPFVCYDLRFADEFWQRADGTDVYVVVANWPAKRAAHWRSLLRARAIENLAYVVGVNRVGSGGGLDYAGDSAVIDPLGADVVEPVDGEGALVADIDAAVVTATRDRFGFLHDRR